MLRATIKTGLGILAALAIGEAICRIAPVQSGWANPPVTAAMPLVRFWPERPYTYSRGWDLQNVVRGRFNALGLPSRLTITGKPGVVLVGDSFIEAAMIPQDKHIEARLQAAIPERDVNAVGVSGADLPDYLVMGRWAAARFGPRVMVVSVNEGDLPGSVQAKVRGYWWSFEAKGPVLHSALNFRLRNTLASSRLADYALWNLRSGPGVILDDMRPKAAPSSSDAGPISNSERLAAEHFAAEVGAFKQTGTEPILMLAPDLASIYAGRAPVRPRLDLLAKAAKTAGVGVLDLNPAFQAAFARDGRLLDFGAADSHWNSHGDEVVAAALADRLKADAAP